MKKLDFEPKSATGTVRARMHHASVWTGKKYQKSVLRILSGLVKNTRKVC